MRAWLIGWRHKTNRWCKIQRTLGLRTKQWRTSFWDFWRVMSRQKKLSRTRFMVISLSVHLYFTFLRKTVGKTIWKFRRSCTLTRPKQLFHVWYLPWFAHAYGDGHTTCVPISFPEPALPLYSLWERDCVGPPCFLNLDHDFEGTASIPKKRQFSMQSNTLLNSLVALYVRYSSFSFQIVFAFVFLVFLTVHTNFQPYENRRANIMESLYLMVLCILAFMQSYEDKTVKDYICCSLVILAALHTLAVLLCKAVGLFRRRLNCCTVCVRESYLDRIVEEIENTPTNSPVFTHEDFERQQSIQDSLRVRSLASSSDNSSFFTTDWVWLTV